MLGFVVYFISKPNNAENFKSLEVFDGKLKREKPILSHNPIYMLSKSYTTTRHLLISWRGPQYMR